MLCVSFLIKLLAHQHRCFSVNFAKVLRTPSFSEHFQTTPCESWKLPYLLLSTVFGNFINHVCPISAINFVWTRFLPIPEWSCSTVIFIAIETPVPGLNSKILKQMKKLPCIIYSVLAQSFPKNWFSSVDKCIRGGNGSFLENDDLLISFKVLLLLLFLYLNSEYVKTTYAKNIKSNAWFLQW